jgi:uncharacterized HhH-GPD family protein
MAPTLQVTGDEEADQLLVDDPFALVVGMLLDQQVKMEQAFGAPKRLAERLGGLDPAAIAAMDPDALDAAFRNRPALHRFPSAFAKRTQELARHLVEHHGGDAAALWTGVASGDELLARVRALPGFGDEKSRIFVALLGKRFGVRPPGWEAASAPFSDEVKRSVADIDSATALEEVRRYKQARKAEGKGKAD